MSCYYDWYRLVFLLLYRAARLERDRGMREWVALIGISFVDAWLLLLLDAWSGRLFGSRLITALSRPELALLFGFIVAVNFRLLLYRGQWRSYLDTFEQYSARERQWRVVAVLLAAGAVVGASVMARG